MSRLEREWWGRTAATHGDVSEELEEAVIEADYALGFLRDMASTADDAWDYLIKAPHPDPRTVYNALRKAEDQVLYALKDIEEVVQSDKGRNVPTDPVYEEMVEDLKILLKEIDAIESECKRLMDDRSYRNLLDDARSAVADYKNVAGEQSMKLADIGKRLIALHRKMMGRV